MKCEICHNQEAYSHLHLADGTFWKIGLHPSQVYLGRSVVLLRRHVEDFFDISEPERTELTEIGISYREALRRLFLPDQLNYAVLGNIVPHVHMHVIPRYATPRDFSGVIFNDANWGKNYAPYDTKFTVPDNVMQGIRTEIRRELK